MALLTPLQTRLARRIKRLRKRMLRHTDARVKMCGEMVVGARDQSQRLGGRLA